MSRCKSIAETSVETQLLAFPSDANTMGIVYGGRILHWVDMVASLTARKLCGGPVATARIEFDFLRPIHVSDHVRIRAVVTRTFERSFEVEVRVWATAGYGTHAEELAGKGYLLFSCLDQQGKAMQAPQVQPESSEEKERWAQAGERRKLREALRRTAKA